MWPVDRAARVTVVAVAIALMAPSSSAAGAAAEGTRLTVAASGDLLIHGPLFRRALAYGDGQRYEFRPMLRTIKPLIAGADLALCHLETPLSHGPPRGYPSFALRSRSPLPSARPAGTRAAPPPITRSTPASAG